MKRERLNIEPAAHTLDLRAELKQFFYRGLPRARTRAGAKSAQRPIVMSKKAPLTLGALMQGSQK